MLESEFPAVAQLLLDAKADLTAFADFPLLRLSACVLIEAHDEWQDGDRRYLSEGSWP